MSKRFLKLDQQKKNITIDGLVLDQQLIFEFFNNQPEKERELLAVKAFYIGILALKEDRLSAFLARTANTLGTELENLKYIFELQNEIFFRTTAKGRDVEHDIVDQLTSYAKSTGYKDVVEHCGESFGALPKNKTGDLIIKINGSDSQCIAIESKFDKAKRLGKPDEKDVFAKGDTAISQLLEAKCNREAGEAIIIFDESAIDGRLKSQIGSARYFPAVGFVCVIDYQKNFFEPLFTCYELARSIVLSSINKKPEYGQLAFIISRFLHDLDIFLKVKKQCRQLLDQCQNIVELVDKGSISLEFSKEVFSKFCERGYMTDQELLDFYSAELVKERYAEIKNGA